MVCTSDESCDSCSPIHGMKRPIHEVVKKDLSILAIMPSFVEYPVVTLDVRKPSAMSHGRRNTSTRGSF